MTGLPALQVIVIGLPVSLFSYQDYSSTVVIHFNYETISDALFYGADENSGENEDCWPDFWWAFFFELPLLF